MNDISKLPYEVRAQHRIGSLAKNLRSALELPGMSIRTAQDSTGVDKSTILRAKQQKPISTEAFLILEMWIDELENTP